MAARDSRGRFIAGSGSRGARFVKDRDGIARLALSADVISACQEAAQGIADRAGQGRSFGGVVPTYQVLDVEADGATAGTAHPIGHIIEFGSVNNPPYAPLRAAATSAGLRFEPG